MNILFVCTGNTCRSPMAAGLMNKIAIDEDLDVRIESAGLFAAEGSPASDEAIEAMKKYDVDLSDHRAKQITPELIEKCDVILTMTAAQKMLLSEVAGDKTYTLCEYAGTEGDIADPFGGDLEEYEEVAQMIYFALQSISEKLNNEK